MATCFLYILFIRLSQKFFDNSLVGIKVVINSSYSYSTVEHRKDDKKFLAFWTEDRINVKPVGSSLFIVGLK